MTNNWVVIYAGNDKGGPSRVSRPQTKRQAIELFEVFNDAKYLAKIKRRKTK